MPRKAKEKDEKIEIIEEKKKGSTATKKSSAKKETTVKKTSKKAADKTETTAKKTTKKAADKTETAAKKTTKKAVDKTETAAKKTTKKAADKTETAAKKTTKKAADKEEPKAKKTATKKTSTKSTGTRKKSSKEAETLEASAQIVEYYDLPYKYGNTVVRLLAQTPKTLFVYWEVSDNDIANFKKLYGEDFFNKTKPILIVHNLTLNKTTEIEINDFANCWYLNTDDSDCKFDIELARKLVDNSSENNEDNYLSIAKSNTLQSPNNHILFEKIQEFVVFRNTSNNNVIKKNIKSFKFLKDIYKFYKDMYDEDVLNNPSSQFKF